MRRMLLGDPPAAARLVSRVPDHAMTASFRRRCAKTRLPGSANDPDPPPGRLAR